VSAAGTSKLMAIRATCLECVEGQAEVRNCTHFNCPLWAFRMGKHPFAASNERRAASRAALGLAPCLTPPKPGAGVDTETLKSWSGRALPMGSVSAPDPRDMTLEELTALGCTNRSPAKALKLHDWERDSSYKDKDRVARIQAPQARNPARTGGLARQRGLGGIQGAQRVRPVEIAPPEERKEAGIPLGSMPGVLAGVRRPGNKDRQAA
jgi:hypothetical protein